MFEHGISATWLRRAQWAIYIFFGGFAIAGLWFVFASALRREVFDAVIAAGVVWGSIGLGIGMHCVTQMAAIVNANMRALTEIRKRADGMEALLEQLGPMTDLSSMGSADPSRLVAASTLEDAFPRLAPGMFDEPVEERDQVGIYEEVLPASPPVSFGTAIDRLRVSFREAIHAGDFEKALTVGEEIARRFPRTEMAVQFEALRDAMKRRARSNADAADAGLLPAAL